MFKDVIHQLPHDNRAKEEMSIACQLYYRDNPRILKDINQFIENYHQDECIKWYTRETFVYKMINKALRTEDIDQLYIFRYYIADLSKQIAERCKMMKNADEKKITLYRGVLITTNELEILKANVGKLFSANSYWSTSRSRSYALSFAKKAMYHSDVVALMYEIICDLQDQDDSVVYADVADLSDFPEEQEVLFDAGSLFQIEEITNVREDDMDLYTIHIRATREERGIVTQYIVQNRIAVEEESLRITLAKLLRQAGKFKRSLQFLQYLKENPDGENMAHILYRIGQILCYDDKHEDALKYLKEAFQLAFYSNPPEKTCSACILHMQGVVYQKQGNHKKALEYYRRAVAILREAKGDINSEMSYFYNSIGEIYRLQGYLKNALEYYYAAIDIRDRVMPNNIDNGFNYEGIANIYSDQKNYKEALKYHLKALKLREKLLPSNHYNTARSQRQVGEIYHAMFDLEKARQFYIKSLESYKTYTDNDFYKEVLQIHQNIARSYSYNTQEALDHRLEAWNILVSTESDDHLSLARLLDEIAFTYKLMGNRQNALRFYKEALKIREEKLPEKTFSLSYSFENLAYLYELMKNTPFALIYHRKALEIYEYYYPYHHWLCEKTRRNIRRVQRRLE